MIEEEVSALNNIEEWSIICYGRISFFVVDTFIFVYESDAFFYFIFTVLSRSRRSSYCYS